MFEMIDASKAFQKGTVNEHMALNHISLKLEKGEFVTVIGSNGAGKSTLFNAICGSFYVDTGSIVLDRKNITYEKEHRRALSIGRVFQDPMRGTAPNMSIEENLSLAYSRANKHLLSRAADKKSTAKFREALAEFGMGLEDRMKTKAGLLSGGQRQALTLLMCTIVSPKLLLLDEHTAALDPAAAEKVLKITNDIIARGGLTAMMITHNINSALEMGSRTIMMNDGKIILDISKEERKKLTIQELMKLYSQKSEKELDNDRMLLSN